MSKSPAPWVAIWLAAVLLALFAPSSPTHAQRFATRTLGLDDGFASAVIRDLTQDELGYLWLATGNGISRYDGRGVRNYGVADGLPWSDIARLAWHGDALYAVGHRAPYPVFRSVDGETFEALPLADLPPAVGGRPRGLAVGLPWAEVAVAIEAGVLLFDGASWRFVTELDGLPGASIQDVAAWQGQLVVATDNGLGWLRDGRVLVADQGHLGGAPSRDIRGLLVDDGRLWIVGRDWVGRLSDAGLAVLASDLDLGLLDPSVLDLNLLDPDLLDPDVLDPDRGSRVGPGPGTKSGVDISVDGQGGLYVAAGGVLSHVRPDRTRPGQIGRDQTGDRQPEAGPLVERLDARRGIKIASVEAVLFDREGSLWIGGGDGEVSDGLVQILDQRLSSLTATDGLYDSLVVSIHRRPDGSLVLGHRGGVSFIGSEGSVVDGLSLPLISADGRRLEQVRDIAEDGRGGLWLTAESKGLARLAADGRLSFFGSGQGLEGTVTSVLSGPSGDPWVGTEQGVFLAVGERFQRLGGSPDFHVRQLARGQDGSLLVATDDGVHRYSPQGEWSSWRCGRGACDSTFGVLPDALGHWVATAAGLYRAPLTGDRLVPSHLPSLSEPIFFVRRIGSDLWLGSEDGLLGITPGTDRLERLSVAEGLAGRETYRSAALVDPAGRLWVGTDRGFSRFDAFQSRPESPPPPVRLEGVVVDGIDHPLDTPLKLSSDVREATFRFRAVTLSGRQPLRFRSWLEGASEMWQPPYTSEEQEFRIAGLMPGSYRFHLQAALGDGEWSDVVISAPILIAQPFWRETWFLGIAAALVLVGIYALPSFLAQRRQSRLLEREVQRRTAELQASEDRYRKTFRSIEDGVVTTDGDGGVALLNPRAEKLTGFNAEQAVGRPVDEVLRLFQVGVGDQTGPPLPLLSASLQDTIGPTHTAILEHRSGSRRHVELTAAPILAGGGFAGLVFAFRDISRKKMVEAELARAQKLEAVGILAGGIAHDFNNLLTVLLGNVSLLQEGGNLDNDENELLSDAETALMRARDLTHQLLTFSRGGAPIREAASISEVIHDSASFVLAGSKVLCDFDLAPDLMVVEIDAGQISQVLNNLLINAAQAMPNGGKVTVIGRNVADPPRSLPRGRFVRIDIVDRGTGIGEQLLPRIFDPYFSTKDEGRGLGLASAYSIIKNHDGLLTVDSELGKGTTFHIFLPASPGGVVPDKQVSSSNFRGQGRVLIMDDDAVVRRTSGAMLERLGFEVVFAENGDRALELYGDGSERRFDLVMMDLTVPGGLGGQETMRRLLKLDPSVQAIVYSGYSNDPVLANYRDHGFVGRLSKPFRLGELRQLLAGLSALADEA